MFFALYLILDYALPVLVAIACTAVWRRNVPSPSLFLAFSWLILLGLQRVISGAWSLAKLGVGSGGFYLELRSEMPEQALLMEGGTVAVLLVVLGIPALAALKTGLSKR